jgi:hypothetical protein
MVGAVSKGHGTSFAIALGLLLAPAGGLTAAAYLRRH